MRYLTRELYKRSGFFSIAFDKKKFKQLSMMGIELLEEVFYNSLERDKEDMISLLPTDLKNKLFDVDGSVR